MVPKPPSLLRASSSQARASPAAATSAPDDDDRLCAPATPASNAGNPDAATTRIDAVATRSRHRNSNRARKRSSIRTSAGPGDQREDDVAGRVGDVERDAASRDREVAVERLLAAVGHHHREVEQRAVGEPGDAARDGEPDAAEPSAGRRGERRATDPDQPPSRHLPRRPRPLAEPEVRDQRGERPDGEPGAAADRVAGEQHDVGGRDDVRDRGEERAGRRSRARRARRPGRRSATAAGSARTRRSPRRARPRRGSRSWPPASSSLRPLTAARAARRRSSAPRSGVIAPVDVEDPGDLGREVPAAREDLGAGAVGDQPRPRRAARRARRTPPRTRRRASRPRPPSPASASPPIRSASSCLRARSIPRVGSSRQTSPGRVLLRAPARHHDRQREALALAAGEVARVGLGGPGETDGRERVAALPRPAARRRPARGPGSRRGSGRAARNPRGASIRPRTGSTSPAAARSRVLFPAPFRPISATRSPRPDAEVDPHATHPSARCRGRARPTDPTPAGRAARRRPDDSRRGDLSRSWTLNELAASVVSRIACTPTGSGRNPARSNIRAPGVARAGSLRERPFEEAARGAVEGDRPVPHRDRRGRRQPRQRSSRCSQRTTAVPHSSLRRRSSQISSSPATGSSCEVGSSSRTRAGRATSAAASATRCSSPPDSVSAVRSSRSGSRAPAPPPRPPERAAPARSPRSSSGSAISARTVVETTWVSGSWATKPTRAGELGRTVLARVEPRDLDPAGDLAAVEVRHQPARGAQQCRLARARAAGERDELPGAHREAHLAERVPPRAPGSGRSDPRVEHGRAIRHWLAASSASLRRSRAAVRAAGRADARTAAPRRSGRAAASSERRRAGVERQLRVGVEAAELRRSARRARRRRSRSRPTTKRRSWRERAHGLPARPRRGARSRAARASPRRRRRGRASPRRAAARAPRARRAPPPGPRSAAASRSRARSPAATGTMREISVAVSAERRGERAQQPQHAVRVDARRIHREGHHHDEDPHARGSRRRRPTRA